MKSEFLYYFVLEWVSSQETGAQGLDVRRGKRGTRGPLEEVGSGDGWEVGGRPKRSLFTHRTFPVKHCTTGVMERLLLQLSLPCRSLHLLPL